MPSSSLLGLIYNVTALLAIATIFDLTTSHWRVGQARIHRVTLGFILSAIGVLVMATPWVYSNGIVFDTRSVLLGISGLFFGLIPTVILMTVTAVLRIFQGGEAVLPGVLVIAVTGAIGIIWGRRRKRPLAEITWYELYFFGLVIHVTMLLLMLLLPWETARGVLNAITVPVLLIYPMATTLLGLLMTNRLQRDQAVEKLLQREAELRAIIEHMPVPLGMNDAQQKVTFLNSKYVETFGYTLEDIPTVEDWWRKAYPDPDYRAAVQTEWAHGRTQKNAFEMVDRQVTCKDGTVRTIQMNFMALARAELIIFHDLTERKRAEDVLRTSEEQFRTLVEAAPTAIFIQTQGEFAYVNHAALRLFGAEQADQLLGRAVADYFHVEPQSRSVIDLFQTNGKQPTLPQAEETLVRLDGTLVSVETSSVPFVFRHQPGALVFVHDLSVRKQAEEAVRASRAQLVKAQEVAHVGSWVWDVAQNRISWSEEMYRIFGVDAQTFQGDPTELIAQAIHPDDRDLVAAYNQRVIEDKVFTPLEYRVQWRDGTVRTVWAEAGELQVDAAGNPERLSGIVQDITWRKQDERALRESESRYRNLLDLAPIGIAVHADGEVQFINPAGAQLIGAASGQEIVGRKWQDFVHPERKLQTYMRDRRLLAGEAVAYPAESVYIKLDGTSVDVEVTAACLEYHGKSAVQVIFTDITERKRANEQLRLQAAALESAANAILITDREGKIEWVNPAFTDLSGYLVEEVMGRDPHDVIGSDAQDAEFYRAMWSTILAGDVWRGQLVNRRKDGSLYPEEQSVTPVRDAQGVITHFVSIKQDISLRVQHELELETVAAVSAALRMATSRAEMQAAVLDQVLASFKVEGAVLEILEPTTGDLQIALGRGVWADLTGKRIPQGKGLSALVLATRQPYLSNDALDDPDIYYPDFFGDCRALAGVPLVVREQITGLLWIGGRRVLQEHDLALLISIADITAGALYRETLHELMQAQAQQMIQIMDSVPEGMVLLDTHGKVLLANPVAERMLVRLAPARVDNLLAHLGGVPLVELLTSPPNGLRHEVRADTRVYEVIARPIPSGPEPEQWILLIDDVTQSRQLQTQMQLQERLATVGQMAAGIAHDFNNIMAVILLYAEMAARTTTLPERDRERLLTIKQQAYRATDLIRQILDFSRQSMLERQLIDLLPLVKEQVKLLERTLPESITTRLDLDQESYVVHADPTRMQQLVMNLAINARDAMPDGGELSIGLARMRVESELGGEHADRPAREWVQLTVADTGEGIPTEVLPRIFDPFFTTKAHGKGTGLGLAQVHGIVAQHDGTIEVTTEPAQGTTFTVYLPARATDSTVVPITFGAETALGHGELVLVVEDNFALRMAMTEMVEAMHYQVVVAADGQAALHLLQTRGHEVAVVLSDVVMPNLGGVALLHAMREQGWTMPVIFMTGHSLETDMAALEGDEVFAWLPKPVSPLQLAGALADAVAQA